MGTLSSYMKREALGPARLLRAIVGVDRGGRGVSRRTLYNFIKSDTGGTRTLALIVVATELLHSKEKVSCPLTYASFDQWSGWVRPLESPHSSVIGVSGPGTLDLDDYRPGAFLRDGADPVLASHLATPSPSESTVGRQQTNPHVGSHVPDANPDSSATSLPDDDQTEGI